MTERQTTQTDRQNSLFSDEGQIVLQRQCVDVCHGHHVVLETQNSVVDICEAAQNHDCAVMYATGTSVTCP